MSRICPEYPDACARERFAAGDVLFRQDPDDENEEEDDDNGAEQEQDDAENNDDGYSE